MTGPLPPGTRVKHRSQEWATYGRCPRGTGEVLDVIGPFSDGTYDYRVRTGRDFSRPPGPDNPEDRETTWPGHAVSTVDFMKLWDSIQALTPEQRETLRERTDTELAEMGRRLDALAGAEGIVRYEARSIGLESEGPA
jgi:hypothetical protein